MPSETGCLFMSAIWSHRTQCSKRKKTVLLSTEPCLFPDALGDSEGASATSLQGLSQMVNACPGLTYRLLCHPHTCQELPGVVPHPAVDLSRLGAPKDASNSRAALPKPRRNMF